MTAIPATFSDFRIVKGRKVAQFVFETPLEAADDALSKLGGLPRPDAERWVGIAPLVGKPKAEQQPEAPPPEPEKVKERRPFHTLPRSQQAAILINDAAFQSWVGSNRTPEETDQMLKAHMGIASKRDLDQPAHAEKWDRMVATFRADAGRQTWERPA
ncbi:MAG: hypothetical protein IPK85_02365 [Gemmatimonadetes bacterium]|nr:hypothetical protein [Gemmatimonadota bacterium]